MNPLKSFLPITVLLATGATLLLASGCSRQDKPTVSNPPAAVATNAVFTCSMHPEVVSNTPGECPKCGMHLVPKN